MFLIPNSNVKKFNTERCCFVLNEFASAEFASALEMLFAAKKVNNEDLSKGFIRHCLDEYKHFLIFSEIKKDLIKRNLINKKNLKFIPSHLYIKGYIYTDKFIYEKKNIKDFAIFIGANEEVAEKKLINFANNIQKKLPEAYEEIQKILKDEERHSYYSLKYAKKVNKKKIFLIKMFKEKIISSLRHFYANNQSKMGIIFKPILIFLVIMLSFCSKFLKLKTKNSEENILQNLDPHSLV